MSDRPSDQSGGGGAGGGGGGGGGGWRRLLQPACRRATTAAVGLNVLQQLCGINVVVYYAPRILSSVGFAPRDSIALTAVIGALQIACGLGLSRVIDDVAGSLSSTCHSFIRRALLRCIRGLHAVYTRSTHGLPPVGWAMRPSAFKTVSSEGGLEPDPCGVGVNA